MIKYFLISVVVLCLGVGAVFAQSGWFIIPPPEGFISFQSCDFPSSDTGYVMAKDIVNKYHLLKTYDGGGKWERLKMQFDTLPPTFDTTSILCWMSFLSPQYGFLRNNNTLMLTTDGGISWKFIKNNDTSIAPEHILFISRSTGYGYAGDKLYKSVDTGMTWIQVFKSTNGYFYDIQFIDTLRGYAHFAENFPNSSIHFWYTSNGGLSWEDDLDLGGDFSHFDWNTSIYVGAAVSSVSRTTDRGTTWSKTRLFTYVPNNIDEINSMSFFHDSVGYIASYWGRIYKTEDGGQSWYFQEAPIEFQNIEKPVFSSVELSTPSKDVAYAIKTKNGIMIKTIDGGGAPVSVKLSPPCDCNTKLSPEVASGAVTITFDALLSSENLEIYDAVGRQVSSAQIPAEATSYRIDISNYASGMYLAKLRGKMYKFVKVGG